MTLSVIGRESLDVLQKWVVDRFSTIVNTNRVSPTYPQAAFGDTCLGREFRLVPVKDLKSVTYMWPLPSARAAFRSKPLALMSHLLGHEGKGSIFSHLKSLGWASALSAGDQGSCSTFTMMVISISLSPSGLHHIPEITHVVYQYIKLLSSASTAELLRHWDENKLVQEMGFRFKSKEDPASYVSTLSNCLAIYPSVNALTGNWLFQEFDEKVQRDFIARLVPTNMIVQYNYHVIILMIS